MARRFSGGSRMTKQWEGVSGTDQHFTADATAILGRLEPPDAITVLRMLGEYVIAPTSAPVAGDAATVSVGICVVSTDAFNVGASAMPEPFGDQGYPWLYWASHPMHFAGTSLDPSSASASVRRSFDVKSMRKMKGDREALVWVVDYFNIVGDPPLICMAGGLRILTAK